MPKTKITLADGGPTIEADVTKIGLLAIHKPVSEAGGFALTHIPTGRVVTRVALKRTAVTIRKEMELLDWGDLEGITLGVSNLACLLTP